MCSITFIMLHILHRAPLCCRVLKWGEGFSEHTEACRHHTAEETACRAVCAPPPPHDSATEVLTPSTAVQGSEKPCEDPVCVTERRRHFLLICGAQCEDSGEILFRARRIESRAKLKVKELPVRIIKSLRDKTALQGHRVIFECKVSPARAAVTWLRGSQVIVPSDKYQISSEDAYRTLIINDVGPEDEDVYTMKTPGGQTNARLLVEGLAIQLYKNLRDVKVTAPDDACFECEVSIPLSRPPQWSLNGVQLHNGGDIIIEARGNRHRLTLQNTYPEMSGTVRFTAGKTRAEAQLIVQEQ